MENMRQKWNAEKLRADALQEQMNTHEYNYSGLRQENRMYKEQLRDARAQITTLMSDKQNLEHDLIELERKFALVNELLKSLLKEKNWQKSSFLNKKSSFHEPVMTEKQLHIRHGVSRTLSRGEDIDYDRTGDSIDISYDDSDESHLRNGKVYRRSRSLVALSNHNSAATVKRSKDSKRMNTVDEEMASSKEWKKPTTTSVLVRRSMNRSMSESNILNQNEETIVDSTTKFNAITSQCGASALDLRSPYTMVKTWTNGSSIETRPHTFANFTSILGDRCEVCNRWIGLAGKAAYKCADCGIRLHKSCTRNAPIPCVPRTATPRTPGKQRPRLKEFCPSTQPMIPSLIIHCAIDKFPYWYLSSGLPPLVNFISVGKVTESPVNDSLSKSSAKLVVFKNHWDSLRFSITASERQPFALITCSQESQIVKLLNEFKSGRSLPKLEYHDTETITGCIKRFLREVRDPVIPVSSWEEFVNAAEHDDFEALNRSVMDLPYPNRDTLAFLCSHFQRVCDNRSRNKMSPEVLARCIAPTIVGRAPPRAINVAQNADEIAKQIMVLLALLKMPQDYWQKFYAFDQEKLLLKSPTCGSTATLIYNQESRTPIRSAFKVASNNSRKNLNKSMLGPIETPLVGKHRRKIEPS
ncbi:hypothetical protein DINM_022993 [Dirofilaria immitis]|nr:hypothetical protein [Dirofilaria immitis]